MSRKTTKHLNKMGRRRFLQSLSALGVSAGTLEFMTKDALAKLTDDPTKEVPRISRLRHKNPEDYREAPLPQQAPEREPVYYTISRDKWKIVESAENGALQLNRSLNKMDGSGLLSAGVTTKVDGKHKKKVIEIDYITHESADGELVRTPGLGYQELRDAIPSSIDAVAGTGPHSETVESIPVTTREVTKVNQAYDGQYRPIPGGCGIAPPAIHNEIGSATSPAWDSDRGEHVLITAGHVLLDGSNNTRAGADYQSWYQPEQNFNSNDYFGSGDKAWDYDGDKSPSEFDAGTIRDDSSSGFAYMMAGASAGTYSPSLIDGIIYWDEIKDKANTGYYLYRQGQKTGRHSGEVTKTIPKGDGYGNFNTNAASDGGDSGGPHFKIYPYDTDDNAAYIAGIHCWGKVGQDFAGAVGIQRAEKHLNLSI